MINPEKFEQFIRKRTHDLVLRRPSILCDAPIEEYLHDMQSVPVLSAYHKISPHLRERLGRIRVEHGRHILAEYQKLALLRCIDNAFERLRHADMPDCILRLFREWFERVVQDMSSNPDEYYDFGSDGFLKDLAVCCLRMIPIGGAWVVETSGMSRKFLLTGGVRQFFEAVYFAVCRMKGLKPYYQIHTVDRYIHQFNAGERTKAYQRVASLLARHPDIKGLFAGSWFYDPALRTVSPRLHYIIELQLQHGARVFRLGTHQADIDLALLKSKTRQRLYQAGQYIPTAYLAVWPRRALIRWAEQQQDDSRKAV